MMPSYLALALPATRIVMMSTRHTIDPASAEV